MYRILFLGVILFGGLSSCVFADARDDAREDIRREERERDYRREDWERQERQRDYIKEDKEKLRIRDEKKSREQYQQRDASEEIVPSEEQGDQPKSGL